MSESKSIIDEMLEKLTSLKKLISVALKISVKMKSELVIIVLSIELDSLFQLVEEDHL
jgi:hypothetical protein